MIKPLLKTTAAMLAGGIVVLALTYNSKMPEIKTGVDELAKIASEYKIEAENAEETIKILQETIKDLEAQLDASLGDKEELEALRATIKELQAKLDKALAEAVYYKGEFEYVLGEYHNEMNKTQALYAELDKANKQIEKANQEQVEILNYINTTIEKVQ